jgi:uncharacterized membrane protein
MEQIIAWCAPWSALFDHSKWISGTVTGVHIMALVIGGGLAIAADRMTLRVPLADAAARRVQLDEVRSVHGIVLVNIILLFVSGVLLSMADIETFLESPVFWVKLALVAALVVNGALLTRLEQRLQHTMSANGPTNPPAINEGTWSRVRLFSWSSVFLWSATAVVGIVLSNAA